MFFSLKEFGYLKKGGKFAPHLQAAQYC